MPSPAKVFTDTAHENIYRIVEQISSTKETPLLIMNTSVIRDRYEQFHEELRELSNAKVFYAVKANPHSDIVKLLYELGTGFEVASKGELDIVSRLGVPPSKIISSNPIKIPIFIESAYERSVNSFTFDSHNEIEKLSRLAAGVTFMFAFWYLTQEANGHLIRNLALMWKTQFHCF